MHWDNLRRLRFTYPCYRFECSYGMNGLWMVLRTCRGRRLLGWGSGMLRLLVGRMMMGISTFTCTSLRSKVGSCWILRKMRIGNQFFLCFGPHSSQISGTWKPILYGLLFSNAGLSRLLHLQFMFLSKHYSHNWQSIWSDCQDALDTPTQHQPTPWWSFRFPKKPPKSHTGKKLFLSRSPLS